MAGTVVAYSEITILDLIDTATYIYYAKDENGSGATKAPEADSKYIGIYSGPPIEGGQPNTPPVGTEWTKYAGEDGANGTGFNRIITKVRRFPQSQWNLYNYYGHEENWSYQTDTETPNSGLSENSHIKVGDTAYIAGVITDRNNISCMLIGTVTAVTNGGVKMITTNFIVGEQGEKGDQGDPGKDANSYFIETNQTEILKFAVRGQNFQLTPDVLNFSIYKRDLTKDDGKTLVENLSESNLSISIINRGILENLVLPAQTVELLDNVFSLKLTNIQDKLTEADELALRIQYKLVDKDGTNIINKILQVRYGIDSDMASLSLEASGIVAAIQNTKMEFGANGLLIKNGGLQIQNNDGKGVLTADTSGNLTLVGVIHATGGEFQGTIKAEDGEFRGTVYATDGEFTGTINAEKGNIGGFEIKDGYLQSTSGDIKLNGAEGKIFAQDIELGTGAKIRDYIELGDNVILSSTSSNNQTFIKVYKDKANNETSLSMNSNGIIEVGSGENKISINGQDGFIASQNYEEGSSGWRIDNSKAVFNDIVARGTIHASVMAYGETQAIGGIMIVRPSTRVLGVEKSGENATILTLEVSEGPLSDGTLQDFKENSYCRVEENYYRILEKDKVNSKIKIEGLVSNTAIGKPIVDFGELGETGIGINGSNNSSLLVPQSISVFEFNEKNGLKSLEPKIILGKLPADNPKYGSARGKYGLYGENVVLSGELTTGFEDANPDRGVYSGIRTIYDENSPTSAAADEKITNCFKDKEGNSTTGPILLWAGATGTSKEEIEKSKFFVDKNGNVFAGSAYFKGTIISDATISASKLVTTTIEGNKEASIPALTIQDAAKGIVFKNGEVNIFSLNNNSIDAIVDKITFNKNFEINSLGEAVLPGVKISEGSATPSIRIKQSRIGYGKTEGMSISDNDNQLDFSNGFDFKFGNQSAMDVRNNEVTINSNFIAKKTINYGNAMEYRPIKESNKIIGYDLYIS